MRDIRFAEALAVLKHEPVSVYTHPAMASLDGTSYGLRRMAHRQRGY